MPVVAEQEVEVAAEAAEEFDGTEYTQLVTAQSRKLRSRRCSSTHHPHTPIEAHSPRSIWGVTEQLNRRGHLDSRTADSR